MDSSKKQTLLELYARVPSFWLWLEWPETPIAKTGNHNNRYGKGLRSTSVVATYLGGRQTVGSLLQAKPKDPKPKDV